MKKGSILLTVLAVLLAVGMVVTPAVAYFTAHTEAEGSAAITLGWKTKIEEDVDGLKKTVRVSNEGPESCYVRVTAFAPDGVVLTYTGDGWSADGDYYLYGSILAAGETTDPIVVEIEPGDYDADDLNIVVVYESTKVTYDASGNPEAPDWNMKAVIKE